MESNEKLKEVEEMFEKEFGYGMNSEKSIYSCCKYELYEQATKSVVFNIEIETKNFLELCMLELMKTNIAKNLFEKGIVTNYIKKIGEVNLEEDEKIILKDVIQHPPVIAAQKLVTNPYLLKDPEKIIMLIRALGVSIKSSF